MLTEKEELFIKQMVELKWQLNRAEDLKYICEDYTKENLDNVMHGYGYETMTEYDIGCSNIPMYEEDSKWYHDQILEMLPKDLREKVTKEDIHLEEYWSERFEETEDVYTDWWNQMAVYSFMSKAAKKCKTVDEVNKLVHPDMNFWPEEPGLEEQMDEQTKALVDWFSFNSHKDNE